MLVPQSSSPVVPALLCAAPLCAALRAGPAAPQDSSTRARQVLGSHLFLAMGQVEAVARPIR
jgi:hypothetical protein